MRVHHPIQLMIVEEVTDVSTPCWASQFTWRMLVKLIGKLIRKSHVPDLLKETWSKVRTHCIIRLLLILVSYNYIVLINIPTFIACSTTVYSFRTCTERIIIYIPWGFFHIIPSTNKFIICIGKRYRKCYVCSTYFSPLYNKTITKNRYY